MNKQKIIKIFKNTLISLGLIFLLLFFPSFVVALLNINVDNISNTAHFILLFSCNIIVLGIFALIYRKTLINDAKTFFKNFGNNMETSIKYWLIGFGIMFVSNLFITYILNKGIAGNEQDVRKLIDFAPLFMIFDVAIYAPLTEELTFRKSIRDIFSNKWLYVITSGLIFGGLHVINYISSPIDLIYLIPYSALGCCFALLYYKTNNIFSSISVHALHNSLAIAIYLLGALL